jgi:peroxiredoxin (alkyl hydroperoxide reductase subunit C)
VFLAEITAFSDRHSEFEKLNTEILGVSIDSVVSVGASSVILLRNAYNGLNILLLCDHFSVKKSYVVSLPYGDLFGYIHRNVTV